MPTTTKEKRAPAKKPPAAKGASKRAPAKKRAPPTGFPTELVDPSDLTPHPRNYREHTEDQLAHIARSIEEHGFYRNVVVAKDGTILAGHGVVLASLSMKLKKIPVIRLDLDPMEPRALKVLAGDNEIARLADIDDRALSEILKEIMGSTGENGDGLLGTGYSPETLAALAMVTRPRSELEDFDAAAEWAGMPEYETTENYPQLLLTFRDDEARQLLVEQLEITKLTKAKTVWSAKYPPTDVWKDHVAVRFGDEADAGND